MTVVPIFCMALIIRSFTQVANIQPPNLIPRTPSRQVTN